MRSIPAGIHLAGGAFEIVPALIGICATPLSGRIQATILFPGRKQMRPARLLLIACLALVASTSAHCDWPKLRHRDTSRQEALREKLALIRLQRPRMFATESDLEATRAAIATNEEIAECYGWLKEWSYSDHFYRNLWCTPKQLQAAAFCYRIENRPPQILRHCTRMMDYLCDAKPNSWTYPRIVRGMSMAYDWLHDDLTPQQRRKYAQRIIACAQSCYRTWRHSELNNHVYLEYGPVLYAGIALYGEGIEEQTVEQLLLDGIELLLDSFIPAHEVISGDGGGWYESMAYHAFFTGEYAHLLELWHSATGENLWSSKGGLKGDAAWMVHNHRPWDNSFIGVADIGKRDSFDTGVAWYLPLLIRHHQDGVAKWWLDELKAEALKRHQAGEPYALSPRMWWPYVLWYDPELRAVPPSELPLSAIFRSLGWASMRSSWEPDATFAVFVCGDWFGGHQHCDNNSFVIHKLAPLAIDSGVYDAGPHRANYSARSIAHNTVLVRDPDEFFSGGTWGQHTDEAHRTENDAGQLYSPSPSRPRDVGPGTPSDRGDIIAWQSTPDFTYVVGDATRSYSPAKLNEFTRAFLYLRPDLFILFDRVESTRATFKKTWLLHSVNQPSCDGSMVELRNGEGKLWCLRLWPEAAQVRTIGGPGHEFEVNGKNFPSEKGNDESGAWRVEVSPATPALRDYFLHVISTSEPPQADCTDDGDFMVISVAAGGKQYVVRLAKSGPLRGELAITAAGTRQVHHLPDDLIAD